VLSIIGIILVTDPFGRIDTDPADQPLSTPNHIGHLPTDLVSKLVRIMICIPSIFGQAAERELPRSMADHLCHEAYRDSGEHEKGGRSGICRSDDDLLGLLPGLGSSRVRTVNTRVKIVADIRYLTTTRTALVGPITLYGWIVLFGVVLSPVFVKRALPVSASRALRYP
jgi:hypothetical protein